MVRSRNTNGAEAYGSRTHLRPHGRPDNDFEDRETHRGLYTSMAIRGSERCSAALLLCHAGEGEVNSLTS
ncbi:MAG: hypothetical protein OJF49_003271 [Ktedonobacterales bacterium]|nr:MAG: hypothetical protein OJF49_003271 [Ktedonobacterales bacterium]